MQEVDGSQVSKVLLVYIPVFSLTRPYTACDNELKAIGLAIETTPSHPISAPSKETWIDGWSEAINNVHQIIIPCVPFVLVYPCCKGKSSAIDDG